MKNHSGAKVRRSTATHAKRSISTQRPQRSVKSHASKVVTKRSTKINNLRAMSSCEADGEPKKTALYDEHVAAGGRIVPFCGYLLPVQYKQGIPESHAHVRTEAGLFDVSHMGQVTITGSKRIQFIESLIVADVTALRPNLAKLTVLTNENGGVIDDCMITKRANELFMVLNAGCKDKDMAHINKHIELFNAANPDDESPIKLHYHDDRSLVALQGPKAHQVLQRLCPELDLVNTPFMESFPLKIKGIDAYATRCGYTGEDGFEIGCANVDAVKLWQTLCNEPEVLPAGLGVRDSLRLEAGLCLYGHELNEDITPVEANLSWTISPRRKKEGGFLGANVILSQLADGVKRKLVGVEILAGAPARDGATLHDSDGRQVGHLTSGGPAPSLDRKKIGIGYVETAFANPDTSLQVNVRGKLSPAKIQKLPFVETHYYRIPPKA